MPADPTVELSKLANDSGGVSFVELSSCCGAVLVRCRDAGSSRTSAKSMCLMREAILGMRPATVVAACNLANSWQSLLLLFFVAITIAATPNARAGQLTYSHSSSALPGAAGPAITLLSITGNNDGTNYTFTLTFSNPTIEGPSSGKNDAVYGFINMDTDKNAATGVTGLFLDADSIETGFGRFSPTTLGIDAYINLSSEGDPLHGAPGLVDLVSTTGFNPFDTVAVTYANKAGSTPSMLSLSIPLSDFTSHQITLLDTGDFSVIVGNVNNATDFLPSPVSTSVIPEPQSAILLVVGMSLMMLESARRKGRLSASQPARLPTLKHSQGGQS
jgi:hypothetical protein